jgi:hypothetical protein
MLKRFNMAFDRFHVWKNNLLIIYKEGPLATANFTLAAKAAAAAAAAFSPSLGHAALPLAAPSAAMPESAFERSLTPEAASHAEADFREWAPQEDVPASLCELIETMHANDRSPEQDGRLPAEFPELLDGGSSPFGTGVGYDLGPGMRFQGVGVFDLDNNYASLGPALTLNIEGELAITTGMQLPVAGGAGTEKLSELFYAGIKLLF